MSKVAIVTDSTAYLPPSIIETYQLTITPQILIWGDETFQDGVDIQPEEFYQRLATAKVMPTTSQVPVVTMQKTFEKLLEAGYDVLGIFISSKFSGTIQSAMQAKEALGKAADKIAIVDSLSTSMGMGFQVLMAARAAQAGASLQECQKIAEDVRGRTGIFFVVDTLEFLHRGGRIGGAQALLGSALNIKPVLTIVNGRIETADKVRTKGKAINRMIDLAVESVSGKTPVRLATLHANAESEAQQILQEVSSRLNPVETFLTTVSPVIGTHTGPGTVGLAFMVGM
ncbi:MAG: DegV family protein [Anaerolineales bacterium]|nr:DegV family protein [Anaerolineales bacterium]MCX7608133.1 DegV family protein [Anaerolineales bacterium]MDW8226276.1 DegV family protein [Anaerolineales bacterium]